MLCGSSAAVMEVETLRLWINHTHSCWGGSDGLGSQSLNHKAKIETTRRCKGQSFGSVALVLEFAHHNGGVSSSGGVEGVVLLWVNMEL